MRQPVRLATCLLMFAALSGGVAAQPATSAPATSPATAAVCFAGTADTSCLAAHYSDLDRRLGDAYKTALKRIDTSGLGRNLVMDWKRALQETQRKWIAYREADCGPPLTYETATAPATTATTQVRCKIAHTEARLTSLLARYPASAP